MNVVYWLRDNSCSSPEDSGYIGITHRFGRRIHEHRKQSKLPEFEAHILFVGSRSECLAIERYYRPRSKIGWNNASGGIHGFLHSIESRAKIGAASKGNANCLGRKDSEETKRRKSASARAIKRIYTDQQKVLMVERLKRANVGRPLSVEHKAKVVQALKDRDRSPATAQKIAAKLRGRERNNDHLLGNKFFLGRKHSEETKRNMSAAAKTRAPRIWTEEQKAKVSVAMKRIRSGLTIREESQLEMGL